MLDAQLEVTLLRVVWPTPTALMTRHQADPNSTLRRKTIRPALLPQTETHDASIARLLRDSIHTGLVCRYEPNQDRPVTCLAQVFRGPDSNLRA